MAKEKAMPVANKIYFLPVYPQIVRAVRYGTVPCAEVVTKLKPVIDEHGQQKVDEAARELLDYEHDGKQICAKLKPQLRVVCRQILGPLPEEAEEFWRNADGSRPKNAPPEEPKQKLTKEADEPQTLPLSPQEELDRRVPRRDPTPQERRLRELTLPQLANELHQARYALRNNEPRSFLGKEAKREITLLEAEFARRKKPIPETPPERVKRKRGA
jgi:hypothetical protein